MTTTDPTATTDPAPGTPHIKVAADPAGANAVDDSRAFDLTGPLPTGLTLLEASAGTGKTYTIAALVARYVAEGIGLDELLVVTFTRAATGELRDRVRGRLVAALEALDRHLAGALGGTLTSPTGGAGADRDPVHALLAEGPRAEVERRRDNLAVALAEFDQATIVTTHAFCHEVLRGLGTAGDVARDVTFLEDDSDLLGDVVDDFYIRKFARQERRAEFDPATANRIARAVTLTPGLEIEPSAAPPGSEADLRFRFAASVRTELARRKQRANTLGYDDVLRSLAESLEPEHAIAADRLRRRFRVVLVDEFQDTDPTQWQVLESAFLRPGAEREASSDGTRDGDDPDSRPDTTVILVGDPKQAIYSFRGADVFTYLHAASQASRWTLPVNWRSDENLIEGVNALLDGAALGHPGIRCRPTHAAAGRGKGALAGSGRLSAVRVRMVSGNDPRLTRTLRGAPSVDSIRRVIAEDLAADVVALLASGTQLAPPSAAPRPIAPGDLAVLVRTNREANRVRQALEAAGIPAVIHGGGSVFATPTALHWLQLLEALERPTSGTRARAVSLSDFVGWDPDRLAGATDREIGALQARLHEWAATLERQGVGALVEAITRSTRLPVRLLAQPGGERRLTDLHHIAELLHAEAGTGHAGPAALAAWLRRRRQEGEQTGAADERSRRLESDADAVAVLTIHRSKGLEFPVVYLPDLAEGGTGEDLPTYHNPDTGRRTLDVGPKNDPDHPDYTRHANLSQDEQRGEDLRQAYVALTRARHQVVLWWGPFASQALSPLTRLLLANRDTAGTMHPRKDFTEDAVGARLAVIESTQLGRVSAETVTPEAVTAELFTPDATAASPGPRPNTEAPAPAALEKPAGHLSVRHFDRVLDTAWRRTSYTALTAAAHEQGGEVVGSEAEDAPLDDEAAVEPATASIYGDDRHGGGRHGAGSPDDGTPDDGTPDDGAVEASLRAEPSLMADLDRGPAFGVLVHSVLEAVAFDDPDLDIALRSAIDSRARFGQAQIPTAPLARALAGVIGTPLGPSVGDLRLAEVSRTDRRDELGFELPLAGGDRPGRHVDVADVARFLRERLDPADPLAAYAERLGDPALGAALRGYLNGSIDLLLRVHGERTDRYVVIDYKTNWLGPPGEALSAWHYRPASMTDAMIQAHYPLQALLYSVAVHRFLRWRLPGYAPEHHLGGILYLFVRGMTGPSTPRVGGNPCGVFTWQPPPALVADLSDLLESDRPEPGLLGGGLAAERPMDIP